MVAIVADSAANLPPDLARDLGIVTVPLHLRLGDAVYRDGVDLTPGDFYARLVEGRMPASTASPSVGDFVDAFRSTGEGEIVCVTVAGSMSSVANDARLAAERFDGRVEIVDSRSASMAEGFVALAAARAARAGGSLDEAVERAREVVGRAVLLATVDTFEFLQRSGRVNRIQAYAATMLDVKPLFRFEGGEVSPAGRPRTRRRALSSLLEQARERIGDLPVHLAGIHAAAPDEAELVVDEIAAASNVVERYVVPVTPVIGANVGPGLVGVAFFCD
jgi:fatty acid kinase fatty acid binding subunit